MKTLFILLLFLNLVASYATSQNLHIEESSKELVVTTPKKIVTIKYVIDHIEFGSSMQVIVAPAVSSSATVGIDYLFHEPAKAQALRNSKGPISLCYPSESSFGILVIDTNQREINLSITVKTVDKELIFNETVKINVKKGISSERYT